MKRNHIIILFLFSSIISTYSQDAHFSQYYNTPFLINPALTGEFNGSNRFILNYRDQWSTLTENSFKTLSFSYDRPVFKNSFYIGGQIISDKAGDADLGLFQISLFIASKVKIYENDFLKLGIQGCWSQYSYNFNNLTWGTQYDGKDFDPNLNSEEISRQESFSFVDFSAGLLWIHNLNNNNNFKLGISALHVSKPSFKSFIDDEEFYMRWNIHGNINYLLPTTNIALSPSVLFMQQGPSNEINAGLSVRYYFISVNDEEPGNRNSNLALGVYFRNKDAIIISTQYNYKSLFDIGLSYDINISKLNQESKTYGGLEISMIYTIPEKKPKLSKHR